MKRSRVRFLALPLIALAAMNLHCEAADEAAGPGGEAGSGGAGAPDGGVDPTASQTLEVEFGPVTFQTVQDLGGCTQTVGTLQILDQE
ncbi:MAG: hypothetical protein KJO76_05200, partial [Gammaproteobacteria bacterium]|nr:hypothetical protein [Gammaproteobacteria bacterium]